MSDILNYIRLAQEYKTKKAPAKRGSETPSGGTPVRIAIVTNFTDDLLVKTLTGMCLSEGLRPEIYVVPFKQYIFQLKNEKSPLGKHKADVTFIFFDVNPYTPSEFLTDAGHAMEIVEDISHLARKQKGMVVVNTLVSPSASQYGRLFREHVLETAISKYNNGIRALASGPKKKGSDNVHIIETSRLIQAIGERQVRDLRGLYAFSQPFTNEFTLAIAKEWMAYIRALYGKTRKAIVVDLDNTLWGGIVGETGPLRIALGPEYPGNAFQQFQRVLLDYYDRGIILAINSRNNPEDVDEVFEKNPHMILKKSHFAAIAVNWNTKTENLANIAKELNIGLDSLVFFDDDPMNRDLVRSQLPEVLVPEFSLQPEEYAKTLLEMDGFHALTLTDEDKNRGKMYAAERERKATLSKMNSSAGTLTKKYLADLKVKIDFKINPVEWMPRLAQLTQKTNQFNLTTRRLTEADITTIIKKGGFVYAADVSDRFGPYGVTILAIVEPAGKKSTAESTPSATLNTFLMSCRIMGRNIEQDFFKKMIQALKAKGFKNLTASFVPTKKNMPVSSFLPSVGAKEIKHHKSGEIEYEIKIK